MKQRTDLTPVAGTFGKYKIMNWNGYKVISGHGKSTYLLDDFERRRRHVMQNINIVVGDPGSGKSYFALRLAEVLDPKFNPYKQVVFERSHLLWLFGTNSPLKMGQAIIIDEAQFIAGARSWFDEVQRDVMNHIEAIRSRGFVIIIVSLHIDLLDKVMRKFVINKLLKMTQRGAAIEYAMWMPTFAKEQYKKRRGVLMMQMPSAEQCAYPSCLICKYLDKNCMTNRAIYERLKRDYLGRLSQGAQQRAALSERKKRVLDYNDLLNKVLAHKDKFVFHGTRVEPESVRLILEEDYGLVVNDSDVRKVVKRGQIKNADAFSKPKEQKAPKIATVHRV